MLAALAAGHADPADPEVRRRSCSAARLRRLIAEPTRPDPLLHELRAAADLADRNGLPIELIAIGVPPDLPVEVRRRLGYLLDCGARRRPAVGPADRGRRGGRGGGQPGHAWHSRRAGSTGPPVADEAGPVEHMHERDGEIRWTQTRWRRT